MSSHLIGNRFKTIANLVLLHLNASVQIARCVWHEQATLSVVRADKYLELLKPQAQPFEKLLSICWRKGKMICQGTAPSITMAVAYLLLHMLLGRLLTNAATFVHFSPMIAAPEPMT
eukprot:scaffold38556_cov34-Prasinocladus_malaysianus.AAC.1